MLLLTGKDIRFSNERAGLKSTTSRNIENESLEMVMVAFYPCRVKSSFSNKICVHLCLVCYHRLGGARLQAFA